MALGVVVATSMEGVAGVFYLRGVAGDAVGFALLLSAWALGSVIGSALGGAGRVAPEPVTAVLLGGGLVSAAILVEGLVPEMLVIAVVFVVGGLGNAVHNVGVRNLVYQQVPADHQAQAWSMVAAMFSAAAALGNVLGTPGLLGSAREVVVLAGACGLVPVVLTVGAGALRGGRRR